MDGAIINTNLLKSKMALHGITVKDLSAIQEWSPATVSRKIAGKTAFTAPEIQACVKLLALDSATASAIFFAGNVS